MRPIKWKDLYTPLYGQHSTLESKQQNQILAGVLSQRGVTTNDWSLLFDIFDTWLLLGKHSCVDTKYYDVDEWKANLTRIFRINSYKLQQILIKDQNFFIKENFIDEEQVTLGEQQVRTYQGYAQRKTTSNQGKTLTDGQPYYNNSGYQPYDAPQTKGSTEQTVDGENVALAVEMNYDETQGRTKKGDHTFSKSDETINKKKTTEYNRDYLAQLQQYLESPQSNFYNAMFAVLNDSLSPYNTIRQ